MHYFTAILIDIETTTQPQEEITTTRSEATTASEAATTTTEAETTAAAETTTTAPTITINENCENTDCGSDYDCFTLQTDEGSEEYCSCGAEAYFDGTTCVENGS